MAEARQNYLPEGLPVPVPEADGLSAPHWSGLLNGELRIQRCRHCRTWQWGPEWICHGCHSFDVEWVTVEPKGLVHSWTRVWHPSHSCLKDHGPYLVVVVELPSCGNVRLIGNLIGDPRQDVRIGMPVVGIFETHAEAAPPYALLNWVSP